MDLKFYLDILKMALKKVIKNCRSCGVILTKKNQFLSSIKRHDNICKECKGEMLNELRRNYEYALDGEDFVIHKSHKSLAPTIKLKETKPEKFPLLVGMIEDTEKYRINRMLGMLHSPETDPEIKRQIIVYLLRSIKLLDRETIASIINNANLMFSSKAVKSSVLIKLAINLEAYTVMLKSIKDVNLKSYEMIQRELEGGKEGEIEVEVPL